MDIKVSPVSSYSSKSLISERNIESAVYAFKNKKGANPENSLELSPIKINDSKQKDF